ANLVFVDRRLILGLEAGYVVAHLSKFESAFAPKRKDDIASQLSQSANFSGDVVLLDDRQVGEPRGLAIRSRTHQKCQREALDSRFPGNLDHVIVWRSHIQRSNEKIRRIQAFPWTDILCGRARGGDGADREEHRQQGQNWSDNPDRPSDAESVPESPQLRKGKKIQAN